MKSMKNILCGLGLMSMSRGLDICQQPLKPKKVMPHHPDVVLNPENDNYRKKYLGVKKRNYKK